MRFTITFILTCLEALLFCCTAVPLEFNVNKYERIPDPLLRSEGGFDDDFPEADQDSTLHYGLTTDELQNNSLEDFVTEIDEEVEELFDETELLHHLIEEEANFLDIIAQKLTGLHPNSSVERYDRVCGGILEPSESGVIRYKVNEEYDKYADCTWIIEVPGATRIEFILEKNGFQDCCDFITITSGYDRVAAIAETGQKLELRDSEPRGFVTGSRAMVRFTAHGFFTGEGFRLRFLKRLDFDTTTKPDGSKCGGVIVGQTGYLNYKLGKRYSNSERCVWLLHSPGSESIYLQLIEDGFQICCDYLSVNTIDPETGAIRNDMKLLNARNWTMTIEAPLLVIFFNSNDYLPGKGFSIQFRSSGNQLNVKYKYKLQHITGLFGTMEYPSEKTKWEGSGRDEQDIFVIASSKVEIPDKFYTVIDWKAQQPNGSFLPHSLAIYEALTEDEVGTRIPPIWLEKEQFRMCKESDCPIANTMSTQYNENLIKSFYVEAPAFIIVYKSLFDGRNGAETRLKFDYSRKLKESTCGGVLEPLQSEYGLISYKENYHYDNLENCSWTIEVPEAAGIYFKLETNGFEKCDRLTVVSIDSVESIVDLSSDGTQTIITGPRAKATFTSDEYEFKVGTGFRLRYEGVTVLPINDCGGIVKPKKGDFGVITYKENWNYANNESCVWLIELLNASSIGFKLEQSGLDFSSDYVTLSSADDEWNETPTGDHSQLRFNGATAVVWGPKAIVRFSSDSSSGGTGFRLSFKKLPNWVTGGEDGNCGGVIVEQSGVLNYKPSREYFNNEQCVWLLHPRNSTSITLNLVWDGFQDCCDYLEVSTIDVKTGSIIKLAARLGKNTLTIEESMVVIVFKSDSSIRGLGFSLVYSSNDTISGTEYGYNLCHVSDRSGEIEYPNSVWESTGSGMNEIFVVARSINSRPVDESLSETKLNWESLIKKANDSCKYGEVTIYSTPESSDWRIIERFPNDNVASHCSDVVTVTVKQLSVSSMFLVIYKPVVHSKNLLKDETTYFRFTYEMDVCGGVYVGRRGVIKHKFNDIYRNNEECVWLIEVPLAESILFELEGGEFEACCDYITVSSIQPFSGMESTEIVISPENRRTSMKGPVAIVTFSSDRSARGYGFRLHFRMKTKMSEEPAFAYQLFHHKLQMQHEFAYNAESNQVVIAAFSAGINLRKRIQVDITVFVPQLNESCYSDSLLIYDVNGRSGRAVVLTKAFAFTDVEFGQSQNETYAFPQSCASLRKIQLQAYKNNEHGQNVSISRSVETGSSFLAIYSSVNVTGNLSNRGFALTSQIK